MFVVHPIQFLHEQLQEDAELPVLYIVSCTSTLVTAVILRCVEGMEHGTVDIFRCDPSILPSRFAFPKPKPKSSVGLKSIRTEYVGFV